MRCCVDLPILLVHQADVPQYKKPGSVVRNSYFWALRSIADEARFAQHWVFDETVWVALCRMLMSFAASGYLGDRETLLEFPPAAEIPEVLRLVSTWAAEDEIWE
ncbi:MAG: hypothetical protein F6J95_009620 [Leptolyngbya sp. SIO1E4]|nr:hypothetical protein [Leptolyngbya sp. SIO1E4]